MLSIIASVLYYIGVVVVGIAFIAVIARTVNIYERHWAAHQEMVKEGIIIE